MQLSILREKAPESTVYHAGIHELSEAGPNKQSGSDDAGVLGWYHCPPCKSQKGQWRTTLRLFITDDRTKSKRVLALGNGGRLARFRSRVWKSKVAIWSK